LPRIAQQRKSLTRSAPSRRAPDFYPDEPLLRLILENVDDLISIYDLDGRQLYNSPSFERLFGTASGSGEYDSFGLVHPDDRDRVRRNFSETVRTGVELREGYRIVAQDGRIRQIESRGSVIRGRSGRPSQVVIISRDVTERTEAAKQLHLLAYALTCTRDCFCLTDLNNSILFVNPAFCETYGYAEDELVGKNVEIIRSRNNPAELTRQILEATMNGSWNGELLNRKKDGTEFPVELWTSVVLDEAGRPVAFTGIARDTSERRRADQLQSVVYRIAQAADVSPTLDELFRAVHGIIAEVMSANNFYISLYDPGTDLISFPYFVDEVDTAGPPRHPEKGLTEYVLRTGKPLLCDTVIHERLLARGEAELIGEPSPIWLGIPLIVEKKVIGVMTVQHYSDPHAYGEREQHMLEFVSSQVARAIERKQAEGALRESEDRYKRFVAKSSEGIWRFELDQPVSVEMPEEEQIRLFYAHAYIAECNDAMAAMYGLTSANEFVGARLGQLLRPGDHTNNALLRDFIRSGYRLTDAESRETGENGNARFYLNNLVGLVEGGLLKRVWGTRRDLTENKRAEELLRLSEEKYRTLFEESKDGIFLSTPDGKLIDVNPAGIELFGYDTMEEMQGIELARDLYVNAEDREIFKRNLARHGYIIDFEFEVKRKNGEKRIVLESASAVRDSQGAIIAYRGFVRDITERKRLEDQFRQAQKMEGIGTLAGGIAHDFNNILGIILGYTAMLQEGKADVGRIAQGLGTIQTAVERGAALVRQLLTFARKADPSFGSIDVNDSVRELARMLTQTFPKTISISLQIEERMPSVVADASQLSQALLNLCLNSRDALVDPDNGSGGGILTLRTRIRPGSELRKKFADAAADEYVCIDVQDNGIGMDAATRSRIFEPFFTTKELGKGTGLGLAVVYGVVNSHHGFIDVASERGAGTTFSLCFPIQARKIVVPQPELPEREEPRGGDETILIVEDEEMLRELLSSLFEEHGYRVLAAKDGAEGVELFKTNAGKIAVVLSDMGLPKLGGWEMFQEMRAVDPEVKAILASGYFDPNLKMTMMKAGAKDFIQKPYISAAVLTRVREVIDKH
jgi:PAS domain S-box-containing protein